MSVIFTACNSEDLGLAASAPWRVVGAFAIASLILWFYDIDTVIELQD